MGDGDASSRAGAGDGGQVLRAVQAVEVTALVGAYRQAHRMAAELHAAFAAHGFAGELLAVVAGLDDAGRPVLRVVLTVAGARRLGEVLAGGPRPPGAPRRPPGRAGRAA